MAVFGELLASPFALGLILIILLLLGIEIARRMGRAAELANDTIDDASRLESASENGEMVVFDMRGSAALAGLKRSFASVTKMLRQMLPGDQPRYQTPWLLSVGPAAGGKTTLLGQTRLVLPQGEPDITADTSVDGLNWWLFDRAVALDVEGDLVIQASGTQSDQATWRGFLDLLKSNRPRRPADGVVLVIPATDLQDLAADDPDSQALLSERASVLRRKLEQAQERLGMRLPVYLLISKCDLVPGFARFSEMLSPERRRQMFGWSNPDPPEADYVAGYVDTAFTSVTSALSRFQLRTFGTAETGDPANFDLVALPAALGKLKEPLRIYMNQIFSASAFAEPFPFRGLYFCGGYGLGQADESSPHRLGAASGWIEPPSGALTDDVHRRVDFVADLFSGKIIYEWNLARPTVGADRKANRRSSLLRTALIAGLVLGPILLWTGYRGLSTRAETLDQGLLSPIVGTLKSGPTTPTELDETARQALQGASQIPHYRLQAAIVPWSEQADQRLATAMTGVYRETVFPATRRSIDRQLGELSTKPVSTPASTPAPAVWNVDSTPEFQTLDQRTTRLGQLERDASRYNCFSPASCTQSGPRVEIFRRMIDSVFDAKLRFPTPAARAFYARVLDDVRVAPLLDSKQRTDLQSATLNASDAMFERLFEDNVLTRDLENLRQRIDALTARAPPVSSVPQVYQDLLDAIDQTRKDLTQPQLAWAGADTLQLGSSFDDWLAEVMRSALLGRAVASEIRRRGDVGFAGFRQNLANPSSIGPLLASKDGAIQLQLSPEVLALEGSLQSLLNQDFMQRSTPYGLALEAPPGSALFWSSEPLDKAVAIADSFASFSAEESGSDEPLAQTTVQASRLRMEEQMLNRVGEAQDFRELPSLFTLTQRENHIASQVANLQSVSAQLSKILAAFEAPPADALATACADWCTSRPATGWCQFTAILETQQRSLIAEIDSLLTARALYTPRDGNFSWWDGTGNLALQSFGVATDDDLDNYLANQKSQAMTLAQTYAEPTLSAVETGNCWGFASQADYRRQKVILSDLADVENKTPNNAIAQLEEFITTQMTATTLDNCLAESSKTTACFATSTPVELQTRPPCDYFLTQRSHLASGITGRCRDITVTAANAAWNTISRSFSNRLQDKFPFIDGDSKPLAQEATPADVENFLQVFEDNRPHIESFLAIADQRAGESPPPWSPAAVAAVRRFMDQMAVVRQFFAPFMTARAESAAALPVLDIQVQFRVNQAMESQNRVDQTTVDGNQILVWTLTVGDTEIQPGDVDPPGRWTYDQPVRLHLTWALNAPTEPLRPDQANVRILDRSVVYDYRNPWSLISLLRANPASPEDFADFADDDPVTLGFSIPTRIVTSSTTTQEPKKEKKKKRKKKEQSTGTPTATDTPSTASPDFTTRVFVRMTVMSPDGSKTELPFPDFPTSVPAFPGS